MPVVAAGENKDLQDPAGHRLREVRGSPLERLPSQDRKVTRFHTFHKFLQDLMFNSQSTGQGGVGGGSDHDTGLLQGAAFMAAASRWQM